MSANADEKAGDGTTPQTLSPAPRGEEGWVLVPREPTEEMCAALENEPCGFGNGTYRAIWKAPYKAMLAAAPKALEPKP